MRDARFRPDTLGAVCKAAEVAEWRAQVESFLASELTADADARGQDKGQSQQVASVGHFWSAASST